MNSTKIGLKKRLIGFSHMFQKSHGLAEESDKEEVGESRWVFLEIDGLTGCVCVCVCVCVCWFERLPLTSAALCVVLWGVQRCAQH